MIFVLNALSHPPTGVNPEVYEDRGRQDYEGFYGVLAAWRLEGFEAV